MELGQRVGNYEIVGRLGSGATASVYKVRHVQLGSLYALKVLDHRPEALRERLLQEGRVQAQLHHPNIVPVTDIVDVGGHPGLVMAYVDGPSLGQHVERTHPLPEAEIDALAHGIIRGVRAAHQQGHIHRDLKPANILLQRVEGQWVPMIADFGLVKLTGTDTGPTQTRSGAIVGSPAFMSPEQTMASRSLDARTDIWALGTVLYAMATNRIPFDHPDVVAVFSLVRQGAYPDPRPLRPDLPERFWRAIEGALTVELDLRIADCDELLAVWEGTAEPRRAPRDSTDTFSGSYLLPDRVAADRPRAEPPQAGPPRAAAKETLDLAPLPSATASDLGPARDRRPLAALIGVAAVLGLGLAAVAAWPTPAPPEPPPSAPAAQAPAPTPDAAPTPAPEAPEAPPAPPPARPRPETPTPPPEVAPTPAPTPPGRFAAAGQAEAVWLVRGGTWYEPGDVEAGTYTVVARFPGRPARAVDGVVVSVKAGASVTITCVAGFYTCRVD